MTSDSNPESTSIISSWKELLSSSVQKASSDKC